MPLRAFRLLAIPTISEPTVASSLSFASVLELAAGQAWTRRAIAHSPIKNARKRGLRTSAQSHKACSSIYGRDESHARYFDSFSLSTRWELIRHINSSSTSSLSLNLLPRMQNAAVTVTSPNVFVQSSKLHTKSNQPSVIWREALQGTSSTSDPLDANRATEIPRQPNDHLNLERGSHADLTQSDCRPALASKLPPGALAQPLSTENAYSAQDRSLNPPPPRNPDSLYHNILYLVNERQPTTPLPSLVDYHGHYPQHQSTRSYNLLLDLSLRHRLYGITYLLFRSLDRYRIARDIETHRLMIQLLIQQGLWDEAWVYLDGLLKRGLLPKDEHGRLGIPFPIWVTFFRISRRRQGHVEDEESNIEVNKAVKTLQERYHFLQGIRPTHMPPLSRTHPFAIYCLVDLMLKTRESIAATTLVKAYFSALPRSLSPKLVFGCLKIIHSLIITRKVKPGLGGYYDTRKRLFDFLKLHPSLRPHSKTLLLLFNLLPKAKRCGTVAWKELMRFKQEFGPQVASQRVLRRVSQLAVKEGRLDITKLIRDSKPPALRRRQAPVDLRRRLPHRVIYPGWGHEGRLWLRHRANIRRKLQDLSRM